MATLEELKQYQDKLKNLSGEQLKNIQSSIENQYGGMDKFRQTFDKGLNRLDGDEYEIGRTIADNLYSKLDVGPTNNNIGIQQSGDSIMSNLKTYQSNLGNLSKEQLENRISGQFGDVNKFKIKLDNSISNMDGESKTEAQNLASNIYSKLGIDGQGETGQGDYGEADTGKQIYIDSASAEGNLNDRTKLFKQRKELYKEKTNRLRDNINQYYQEGIDRTSDLSDKLMNINSNIANRIKEQEAIIEDKFNEMQANLDTISENQRRVSAAQQAGAKAAAERGLRGQLGGAAEAQIANYVQKSNQEAAQKQAQLETDIAQQANTLKQNYITAKNNIMQSANLNENQKAQYLQTIDNKISQLDNTQRQVESDLINMEYVPEEQELQVQEDISQKSLLNRLNNRLTTTNLRWEETDPLWRKDSLRNIITTAGQSGINIPDNVYNDAVNANTSTDATRILSNYIAGQLGTLATGTTGTTGTGTTGTTGDGLTDQEIQYNQKWQNITPEQKDRIVNNIINSRSDIFFGDNIINQMKNAPSYTEFTNILNNYVRSYEGTEGGSETTGGSVVEEDNTFRSEGTIETPDNINNLIDLITEYRKLYNDEEIINILKQSGATDEQINTAFNNL